MKKLTFLLSCMLALPVLAQDVLLDPYTRDETISNTVISVSIKTLADGNYLYEYTAKSPTTNLGRVLSLKIDVSCDVPGAGAGGYEVLESYSEDSKHIVLSGAHRDYPNSYPPKVTADNQVSFPLNLKPGQIKTGRILVSPEAPVYREFILKPIMSTAGYAYTEDMLDDPTVPWVDDFTVTGTVLAPRCTTDNSDIPPYDGDGGNDDPTDCQPGNNGQGNAYGLDKGKGHEISNGNHSGHSHDCE